MVRLFCKNKKIVKCDSMVLVATNYPACIMIGNDASLCSTYQFLRDQKHCQNHIISFLSTSNCSHTVKINDADKMLMVDMPGCK